MELAYHSITLHCIQSAFVVLQQGTDLSASVIITDKLFHESLQFFQLCQFARYITYKFVFLHLGVLIAF